MLNPQFYNDSPTICNQEKWDSYCLLNTVTIMVQVYCSVEVNSLKIILCMIEIKN